MEERIKKLEIDINNIKDRNIKVELDKEWETCLVRKLLIIVFTYLPLGGYMYVIGVENPWLNAIVPTLGFLISTLAFPWVKNIWINRKTK